MDVLQAVVKFAEHLLDIAENSPYGMAFVLLLLVGFYGVIDRVTHFIIALRHRRRASETEPDEIVTNPNAELATALSKLSDALLIFANGFTPVLQNIKDTTERTEAGTAKVSGEQTEIKISNAAANLAQTEALRTLTIATEALLNRLDERETKTDAQAGRNQAVTDINAHTDETLKPVVQALSAIPPELKAINLKIEDLPVRFVPIVAQAFSALAAERDQAVARAQTAEAQIVTLTGDLMSRDKAVADLQASLSKLQPPVVVPTVAPTGIAIAPEGGAA